MKITKIQRLTRLSLLITVALMLSYLESLIPILPIPGAKIGLANIVILFALLTMSFGDGLVIILLRTTISAFLFTSLSYLFYALVGGIASLITMYIVLKFIKKDTFTIGVSVIGAITHSLAQVIVAMIILESSAVLSFLPWLIIIAVPTGIFVGISVRYLKVYTRGIFKT